MGADARSDVATALFDIGAVCFGEFRLKLHDSDPSAPLSPFYVNLRLVRSFPAVMNEVVRLLADVLQGYRFDLIADVPTAATPIVSVLSHELGVPMISPRLDRKSHGIRTAIDGSFKPGQTVAVVDDLITRAQSKFEAIDVLEQAGLEVVHIEVLIDREQGGMEELLRAGYSCHAVFTLHELLQTYRRQGLIPAIHYNRSLAYIDSERVLH